MAYEGESLRKSESFSLPGGLSLLLHVVAFFIQLVGLWTFFSIPASGWAEFPRNLMCFAASSALTFSIQRLLLYSGWALGRAWRYRLAVMASAGLGLCLWFFQTNSNHFISLASAFCGAFAGGLMVTSVDLGLAELNSPPPRAVEEQVRQRHEELIRGELPEPWGKYYFDIFMALLGLIILTPVWLGIVILIWWEDPGPIFFIKNSVGKHGINFRQLKFRTMIWNAEKETGPVLADKDDKRILAFGRFLRKIAVDELPQLINILRGEMSLVGPRPQRTVLVYEYLNDLPKYALRHKVRPGVAGLAQVAGHYFLTPMQKLRFDRIYIRHMSTWFDVKLLLCALFIVSWLRWQKEWDGCLPNWLR